MPFKYADPIDRVLANSIADGECWRWIGRYKIANDGVLRPTVTVRREGAVKTMLAYAFAKWAVTGIKPRKGQVHAHSCNNPWCVNPDHIRRTTQRSNVRQTVRDGRHRGPWSLSRENVEAYQDMHSE